jgi:hypothetical protein
MTTHPLAPFPRKSVTTEQPLRGFRLSDFMPSWGGMARTR